MSDYIPPIKLVARRKIIGREWSFRRGAILEGHRDTDGTWRVWPPGQDNAFLVGVPRWYVRRIRYLGKGRKRKPRSSQHNCRTKSIHKQGKSMSIDHQQISKALGSSMLTTEQLVSDRIASATRIAALERENAEWRGKIAQAEADNAGLLRIAKEAINAWGHSELQRLNQAIYNDLAKPHPGASLLARLSKLELVYTAAQACERDAAGEQEVSREHWLALFSAVADVTQPEQGSRR